MLRLFHPLLLLAPKISGHKLDGRKVSCDEGNLTHRAFLLVIFLRLITFMFLLYGFKYL
jgi:hypothetical protein